MATIVKELRDALVEAGVGTAHAELAAEKVMPFELGVTQAQLSVAIADLKTHLSDKLTELTWRLAGLMAGLLVAQSAAIVALIKLLPGAGQ
jgi:hypothetical protein